MEHSIIKQIRPTLVFLSLSTILFGIIYPVLITLILQFTFTEKANGELLYKNNILIGSALLGQSFSQPQYFWSRPSATAPAYNSLASTGSNLSPTSSAYSSLITDRIHILKPNDSTQEKPIPIDLVTASASGLDPHITLAAAHYQVARIASTRHIDEKALYMLIELMLEPRQYGMLGESRLNVLKLNMKLDEMSPNNDRE